MEELGENDILPKYAEEIKATIKFYADQGESKSFFDASLKELLKEVEAV